MTYITNNPSFMKIILTLTLVMMYSGCKGQTGGQTNGPTDQSDNTNPVLLADPTIFVHDNTYYLYGTGGHDADQGFEVYTPTDMQS